MHSAPGTWIPVETDAFHPALTSPAPSPAVSQSVDAHQLLSGVIGQLRRQIDAKRLDLNLQLIARGYQIRGDRERMEQTYRNVISSAIGYAPRGGQLTIRSSCPTPEALRVEVTHCTAAAARAARAAAAAQAAALAATGACARTH